MLALLLFPFELPADVLQCRPLIVDLVAAFGFLLVLFGFLGRVLQLPNVIARESGAVRRAVDQLVKHVGRAGFQMAFKRNSPVAGDRVENAEATFLKLRNSLERQFNAAVFGDLFRIAFIYGV